MIYNFKYYFSFSSFVLLFCVFWSNTMFIKASINYSKKCVRIKVRWVKAAEREWKRCCSCFSWKKEKKRERKKDQHFQALSCPKSAKRKTFSNFENLWIIELYAIFAYKLIHIWWITFNHQTYFLTTLVYSCLKSFIWSTYSWRKNLKKKILYYLNSINLLSVIYLVLFQSI